ncbi:MAG TPA: DMT family transporter [Xanthobacteraceae bacterium]|nr:DMT family transporter [Xanthobacteraceae bacterium]
MSSSSANSRGVLAMIGACACFSANDAATKVAVAWLPPSEIVGIRAVFTLLFAAAIIALRGELASLPRIWNLKVILRAVAEALTGFILITALAFMTLANVTAILMIQPLLLAAVAALLFKQSVGWRRWLSILVGFTGMLLVVKPATGDFNASSLLVLGATFLVVVRDMLTSRIPGEIPTTVVAFATAVIGLGIGVVGAVAESWVVPSPVALAWVIVAAVFLVTAFILIVIAFRTAEASLAVPFRYSIVVFAVIFGFALFGDIPDRWSLIGIVLIVGAGVYMVHREAVRRRTLTAVGPLQGPSAPL